MPHVGQPAANSVDECPRPQGELTDCIDEEGDRRGFPPWMPLDHLGHLPCLSGADVRSASRYLRARLLTIPV